MAVKYEIEYNDVVNVLHRFELYDDNYTADPIPVNGKVVLDYGEVNENLEAIRGQGLRVSLEADQSLTFEELFTENEKTFRCIYYRAGVILFQGWLNPEGFFEDYVNDKWVVSFDCIDGLGYLKNLAFVNDDGTNITGVKSQLEILSLALRRTGIEVNINVAIDVFYTGLADTSSILENVKANTRRYIKDDEVTVMNCEEVIRDILEPYGAVLTSYNDNGEWAVYKPNQLVSNQTATFFRYDYLGVALSPTTITYDFDFTIGSQVDGYDPHYCNGNQQFTNKSSFGAYRISYKYGLLASLIENEDLYTADGSTYDDFTITDASRMRIPAAGGYGAEVEINGSVSALVECFRSDGISVDINASFSVGVVLGTEERANARLTIQLIGGGNTYYFKESFVGSGVGTWETSLNWQTVAVLTSADSIINYSLPVTPVSGDLTIILYNATFGGNSGFTKYKKISLGREDEGTSNVLGEIFTFERENSPSARIEKTREVFTGDSDLDIYEGTLYQSDGTTPTETWFRKGITEAVPILELMGSETMRMNANTMRIFSGDVFGYFNYLSVITIDGRAGKFGVTKYSYDTYANVISMTIKQMFSAELTDLELQIQLDYGNVVEPTIKG